METSTFKTNTRTAIATQQVIDFTHMRRTGIVKIVAIGKKKRNVKGEIIDDLSVSQKFFQDYRTGIFYGIPVGINELTGEYTWKRLRLFDGKIYNLSDEADAKEWHVVQHWPIIKDSIMDTRGIAQFKIEDMDNEAEAYLADYEKARAAKDYVMDLSEKEMMDFALAFNIDIKNNSSKVVKKMLLEIAERKTAEGKNLMAEKIENKKDLAVLIAFRRAKFNGLITETVAGLAYKNSLPLGASEYQAIEYLKKNPTLFNSIDAETKSISPKDVKEFVPLASNEAQKLAWLRSEASKLGIEKYWMKSADTLTVEIQEKKNSAKEKTTEQATKAPKKKGEKDAETTEDF